MGSRKEKDEAKTIESKDGEAILIRPMSWRDLGKLRGMHSHLSPETLRLDGTTPLTEPRPSVTEIGYLLIWALLQSKLALSSIGWIRSFLALFPRGAYLSHVAVNHNNEIVGFRTCNILARKRDNKYIVEDMIVLRDDYQGKGVGAKFLVAALEMISPKVALVCAEILTTNARSMAMYARIGSRTIGTRTHEDGREFAVVVVHLPLREARRSPPRDSHLTLGPSK
jgi:L-amino acid N-acyltransferase YncA